MLLLMGSIYGVQAQTFDFSCEIVCIDNDGDGFTVCDETTLLELGFVNLDFGVDDVGGVIPAFWGKPYTLNRQLEEVIIAYSSTEPHYRLGSGTTFQPPVGVDTLAEALAILDNH